MPRRISPSGPSGWTGHRPGMTKAKIGSEVAPASSLSPDWEFVGYHGTLWSSMNSRPCTHLFGGARSLQSLTVDKLKEWLPATRFGRDHSARAARQSLRRCNHDG